ncbi:MAG: hypothetical protein NC347_00310 [Clostridium sp.]|nr:hypothetical protein [Clostridium sp.]
MFKEKQIGKYNIVYEGISYDGKIPYRMFIITEFEGNTPIREITLYFRRNIGTEEKYLMPDMRTESDIERWLQYPDESKIQIYNQLVVETV